jgi:outer membrane protein
MKTRTVVALLGTVFSAAQVQAATSLLDAWLAAKSHDSQFAAARADYEAGTTGHDLARSVLMPQVVGVATTGRASMNNTTEGAQFTTPTMGTSNQVDFRTSINNGTLNQWGIQASMPLIDAAAWAQSHQLEAGAKLAEERYRIARQDLIVRTAAAFFDVMLARDALATLEKQQQAVARMQKEKQDRYRLGDIPVTDSLEAEAQAEDISAKVLSAQSDLQLKEQVYRDLTGLDPELLPVINVDLDPSVRGLAPLDSWQSLARANSPMITMSALGEDVSRYEIDKFKAWKSPRITLVGSVGSDRLSGDGNYGPSTVTSRNNMIGIQLTIPIFTGGYRSAKLEEAIHQEEKASQDLETTKQWVARETESAWLGLSLGSQRVAALRQSLRANLARLKATQTGNQVGDRTTLDVLNAQSALSQARLALTAAQVDLMMCRLRLQAVSGQLDDRELNALDGFLR